MLHDNHELWCFRLDLSLWPTKEFKRDMDVEELHGYAYVDVHLSICVYT